MLTDKGTIRSVDEAKIDSIVRTKFADFLVDIKATDKEVEMFKLQAILSGGAIASILNNEIPKDFDVYFMTKEVADIFRDKVERSKDCVSASEFAALHRSQVQIVSKFFGAPEKVIAKFDFRHARNYWTYGSGLISNTESLRLVFEKRLVYDPANEYPLSSLMRVVKFAKRGWDINLRDMLMIVFKLQKLDLTDPDTLIEQTKGVDPGEIGRLIHAFKKMRDDGTEINLEVISSAIDKAWKIPF